MIQLSSQSSPSLKRKRDENHNPNVPCKKQRRDSNSSQSQSQNVNMQFSQSTIIKSTPLKEVTNKQQKMEQLLKKIKRIEQFYNDQTEPIFDSKATVTSNINAFLNLGIMSRNEWLKEIGNVSASSLQKFYGSSQSQPEEYKKTYHWLEKLRIAQELKKKQIRIENEKKLPK